MALTVKQWSKTVSFQYDLDKVKGKKAFISARNPATSEVFEEKKEILNDGSGAVSFPIHYTGLCDVHVNGSAQSPGDSGQIHVG